MKKKLGIIGNGNFTKFIAPILGEYFELYIFSRTEIFKDNHPLSLLQKEGILEQMDFLIFSVPLSSL